MAKYINADKLREKIYAEDTVSLAHGSLPEFDQGCHHAFLTVLSFIDSLQKEAEEERKKRNNEMQKTSIEYRDSVIKHIEAKRILPSFKGQLLHDFKNELNTMKQILNIQIWPEIQYAIFEKVALAFATWGGYHFHPKKVLTEASPQPESSKGKFVFPNFLYARTIDNKTIDVSYAPQSLDAVEYIKNDSIEQPEMDLEKAADNCIAEFADYIMDENAPEEINLTEKLREIFKDGVEWMTKQGVSVNAISSTEEDGITEEGMKLISDYLESLPDKTEVVLQIRKKQ